MYKSFNNKCDLFTGVRDETLSELEGEEAFARGDFEVMFQKGGLTCNKAVICHGCECDTTTTILDSKASSSHVLHTPCRVAQNDCGDATGDATGADGGDCAGRGRYMTGDREIACQTPLTPQSKLKRRCVELERSKVQLKHRVAKEVV